MHDNLFWFIRGYLTGGGYLVILPSQKICDDVMRSTQDNLQFHLKPSDVSVVNCVSSINDSCTNITDAAKVQCFALTMPSDREIDEQSADYAQELEEEIEKYILFQPQKSKGTRKLCTADDDQCIAVNFKRQDVEGALQSETKIEVVHCEISIAPPLTSCEKCRSEHSCMAVEGGKAVAVPHR